MKGNYLRRRGKFFICREILRYTDEGRARQARERVRAACFLRGMQIARSFSMIRKLPNGQYRLYSRQVDSRTHRRKNLGTFESREAAEKHERAVQFFKRRG